MKFVLSSDWHLRLDQLVNRNDDFFQTQYETIRQIRDTCLENKANLIIAGDIFHRAKEENMQKLLNIIYDLFKNINIIFIPGQHDLLFHSMDNFDKGNIGILNRFNNWKNNNLYNKDYSLFLFNWGQELKKHEDLNREAIKIAVLHKFISDQPLPPWMKDKGMEAKELCEKYNFDVFVCGDNHKSFIYGHPKTKQLVFNCGCITRQKINEKEYKPNIFLFDTETKQYEIIYLKDDQDVFSKVTTNKLQLERNVRINSFIELVETQNGVNFDFESDLKNHCEKNKIDKNVINEIDKILMEAKG